MKTHLVKQVTNYNRDQVISETEPEVVSQVDISQENLKIVQEAMKGVTQSGGTANSIFGDYGITIAAKTGTAENPGHSDNVTFIAYAPYDDPEIAVAVVLEYGSRGTYSMNVAKDIFDAYFYGKTVSDFLQPRAVRDKFLIALAVLSLAFLFAVTHLQPIVLFIRDMS